MTPTSLDVAIRTWLLTNIPSQRDFAAYWFRLVRENRLRHRKLSANNWANLAGVN
jgi:hypothetical protein